MNESEHKKLFSPERKVQPHINHSFNNSENKLSSNQKHLGLTLDSKLSFNEHINDKIHQANKVLVSFENCKQFYHVAAY